MTDENAQVIAALNKDFLNTYVELASRRNPLTLHDGDGIPVWVKHTTIHKSGPGYGEIFKNGGQIGVFTGMRGCVVRASQGEFVRQLKEVLD